MRPEASRGRCARLAPAASVALPLVLAASVALALVLAAAPSAAGLFDDDVARRQIVEQQKRLDEMRLHSDAVAGRITRIEETLKNQPVLELANQLELLRQEIKSLRGQLEVLGNNVEGTAKRQRDMYVDLDTRLRRFEQQPPAAVPPPPPPAAATGSAPTPSGAGTPAPVAAGAASAEETQAYEAAQNQRRVGNYQGAIAGFQAFVAQHPKSTLAPRAQYWIGDSYFNLRDYRNAIANQQKLVTAYPDSPSVPDALLNMASSQAELGDAPTARKTMDGLVARYPASEAAEKAKRRLTTLK